MNCELYRQTDRLLKMTNKQDSSDKFNKKKSTVKKIMHPAAKAND